ncbi:hypothetical protein EGR_07059 [Echinococcus granulosus]|uniref:Uncharacterized protein n=1 Tax=Echinococcus granulosus TaxID=6210 RepID=W6UX96_ECHGR|nr:hypothetical protein EGR_07059 [Echinococcus granulosus]EUB58139.1 hypothetical protein EGR_07059 [Echinococcus granulosus]
MGVPRNKALKIVDISVCVNPDNEGSGEGPQLTRNRPYSQSVAATQLKELLPQWDIPHATEALNVKLKYFAYEDLTSSKGLGSLWSKTNIGGIQA